MMQIIRFNELKEFPTSEGIVKPLFSSEELKMIYLKIPAGLKEHPHPHHAPQNLLVLKGSVRLNVDMPFLLREGDMAHIPADSVIGMESDGDAEALLISSLPSIRSRGKTPPLIVVRSTSSSEHSLQLCNFHVCGHK